MGGGAGISWGRLILGSLLALVVAGALATLVGPLLAARATGGASHQIRDDSMAPALVTGDWVLSEALQPAALPARGDVVVYEHPGRPGHELIARVVALPGERVQMRGGAVYIDGARAAMERLEDRVLTKRPSGRGAPMPLCIDDPVEPNGACRQEVWRETLPGGAVQRVLNTRGQIGVARPAGGEGANDTGLVGVPADHVFVMGDNRDHAFDSRSPRHGPVPLHRIRHRVWLIHTSLDRSARFFTPRWERFFREVR